MKEKLFVQLFLSAMILLLAPTGASAQVTIGSGNPPSSWSLLDLDTKPGDESGVKRGLHLPRLSTKERDALVDDKSASNTQSLAVGLFLYNTDTHCLDFWNGSGWISICADDMPDPCAGISNLQKISFCSNPNPTIADLTALVLASGGNGAVQWYANPTEGDPLPPGFMLEAGVDYWAGNCAGLSHRTPVSITLNFCDELPFEHVSARITTFVNVMYDFQHQILEAWHNAGTAVSNYKWLVSDDNENFTILSNGSSSTFEIPSYFINDYVTDEKSRELFFRCILTTSSGDISTVSLGVYFIRTNTSGFGVDITANDDEIRYLTIRRGGDFNDGEIKIALLNLGASGTGAWLDGVHIPGDNSKLDDAGDLGDFYQWGRVADGHQYTVWSKNASHVNQILPFDGGGNATSAVVPFNNGGVTPVYDTSSGQVTNATPHYGNFIYSGTTSVDGARDWHYPHDYTLWGNGSTVRAHANITPELGWSHGENNPCPPGWRIPSRWNIWDIYAGDGTDIPPEAEADPIYEYAGTVNQWYWREASHDAYGGAIIVNEYGEKVFLPAVGRRMYSTGNLDGASSHGYYWSSTQHITDTSFGLHFTGSLVYGNHTYKGYGYAIRCVSE